MKNIYLVLLVIIAIAVFILGMAIFIAQIRNPQTSQSQVEINQPQTEGSAGGAAGEPQVISKEEYERQAIFERTRESTAPASPNQ